MLLRENLTELKVVDIGNNKFIIFIGNFVFRKWGEKLFRMKKVEFFERYKGVVNKFFRKRS